MTNEEFKDRFGYLPEEMERIEVDQAEPFLGVQVGIKGLKVHPKYACKNPDRCCIHNPSDHHMKDWPLNWRADRGLMERIDPRTGIGHPDPDDVAFHESQGHEIKNYTTHGCDGGCIPPVEATVLK